MCYMDTAEKQDILSKQRLSNPEEKKIFQDGDVEKHY